MSRIKTDLGSASYIRGGCLAHQVWQGDCPFCRREVQIPVPAEFVDYKSMNDEYRERLREAHKFISDQAMEIRRLKVEISVFRKRIKKAMED